MLCSKKFGLTGQENDFIRIVTDAQKMDNALEEILFTDNKEEILKILK